MKNWNWLLIAWWLIPIFGWASIILLMTEDSIGWYLLLFTAVWIFICLVWGLYTTKKDNKIYQDALIMKEMVNKIMEEEK